MIRTLVWNDIRANRLITAVIGLFILLAALLTATALGLFVQLTGSIDRMMHEQKTPHFLQMHAGPLDTGALSAFAQRREEVTQWLVQDFLNLDGAQIHLGEHTLSESTQDNGLVTQNEAFDWLVDPQGQRIQPKPGEIWLPLMYLQNGTASIGDPVRIGETRFVVAGFLRDSQMNSSLAGSKRLLVAEEDYQKVLPLGKVESLIEFRLVSEEQIPGFAAAYQKADLPANGPTVTWPLFRIMSGITDGILIAVFTLAAALVLLIAFLCIRFTLLAQMEEDYREIGVMKAIGLPLGDIRRLYLAKYGILAGLAALAGFLLSLWVTPVLSGNIRLHMGVPDTPMPGLAAGLLGSILIFLVILFHVYRMLGRFRHISASEAVRFGASQEKGRVRGPALSRSRLPVNLSLGLQDVSARRRLYTTLVLVILFSTFLLVVPQNIANTLHDPSFITYNGIGAGDLILTLQQTDDIEGKETQLQKDLAVDPDVAAFTVLTSRLFDSKNEKIAGRMKVDTGDHSVFPIHYTEGRAPETDTEIALSVLLAEDYEKQPGDTLTLEVDGKDRPLTVTGLYSDITNGGKTAKACFTSRGEILGSTVYVAFLDGIDLQEKARVYAEQFPFARVAEVDAYFARSTGPLSSALRTASLAALAVSVSLLFLVTILFLRLLIVKDRRSLAILKTLGFTDSDLRRQFLARTLATGLSGILLGLFFANTVGERLGTALISGFGVARLHFVIRPFLIFGATPLLILFVIGLSTALGTRVMTSTDLSNPLKE